MGGSMIALLNTITDEWTYEVDGSAIADNQVCFDLVQQRRWDPLTELPQARAITQPPSTKR